MTGLRPARSLLADGRERAVAGRSSRREGATDVAGQSVERFTSSSTFDAPPRTHVAGQTVASEHSPAPACGKLAPRMRETVVASAEASSTLEAPRADSSSLRSALLGADTIRPAALHDRHRCVSRQASRVSWEVVCLRRASGMPSCGDPMDEAAMGPCSLANGEALLRATGIRCPTDSSEAASRPRDDSPEVLHAWPAPPPRPVSSSGC